METKKKIPKSIPSLKIEYKSYYNYLTDLQVTTSIKYRDIVVRTSSKTQIKGTNSWVLLSMSVIIKGILLPFIKLNQ